MRVVPDRKPDWVEDTRPESPSYQSWRRKFWFTEGIMLDLITCDVYDLALTRDGLLMAKDRDGQAIGDFILNEDVQAVYRAWLEGILLGGRDGEGT